MLRASILGPERDWTTYSLFLCHFLSTWNARSYEFASVRSSAAFQCGIVQELMLSGPVHGCVFSGGLDCCFLDVSTTSGSEWCSSLIRYLSGITTSVAIILFASSLGRWVDHAPSRLRTLLTTVSVNRVVVIAACLCWSLIVNSGGEMSESVIADPDSATAEPRPLKIHQMKDLLFLVILLLGIAERLSRLANLLSIERDWVPTLAAAGMDAKEPQQYDLTHLNAIMGRIDLICKLGSPIAVSAFMSTTGSPRLGCFGLMALNLITWPLEYWTARQVWSGNEQLQELKATDTLSDDGTGGNEGSHDSNLLNGHNSSLWQHASGAIQGLCSWISEYGQSLQQYFATEVWMPSLAMSSLHISVLTFSATLTIFLLHSGFSMRLITLAEVLSAVFELSSTVIFPWGVHFLSSVPTYYAALTEDPEASETTSPTRVSSGVDNELQLSKGLTSAAHQDVGVSRLGMWALGFMLLCLVSTNGPIE